MHANEQLIKHFYTCFQNMDYKGMQACYAENATFNDSVFKNLNADQVKAMWQMLISSAKEFKIEFSKVDADEKTGSAHWDAYYIFSKTGNNVVNRIDATFEIKDGKIVKHTDHFNFYTWAKQALGTTGLLLGWTSFLKKKIQTTAMDNLEKFMKNK
ncbi:MAG: nuclear transport factor 2 family protein [Pedobacter sp.]|nr:MAG: nuclear transport factor 2 family protein [Pedobacter sp.]